MEWNIDICNDKDHSSRKGYSQTKMYDLAGGDTAEIQLRVNLTLFDKAHNGRQLIYRCTDEAFVVRFQ